MTVAIVRSATVSRVSRLVVNEAMIFLWVQTSRGRAAALDGSRNRQ